MKTRLQEIQDSKPKQRDDEPWKEYWKRQDVKIWYTERQIFFDEVKILKLKLHTKSKAALAIHDHNYDKDFLYKLYKKKKLFQYCREKYTSFGKTSEHHLLKWLGVLPPEGKNYICPHCGYATATVEPFKPDMQVR